VLVNLHDLLDPPKEDPTERSARVECRAWLRSYLAAGPRPSIRAEKAALAAGYSVKHGGPKQDQNWDWILLPTRAPLDERPRVP